jgi:hypothetical protein
VSPQLHQECEAALRGRYAQYGEAEFDDVIVFDVKGVLGWTGAGGQSAGTDPLR